MGMASPVRPNLHRTSGAGKLNVCNHVSGGQHLSRTHASRFLQPPLEAPTILSLQWGDDDSDQNSFKHIILEVQNKERADLLVKSLCYVRSGREQLSPLFFDDAFTTPRY